MYNNLLVKLISLWQAMATQMNDMSKLPYVHANVFSIQMEIFHEINSTKLNDHTFCLFSQRNS